MPRNCSCGRKRKSSCGMGIHPEGVHMEITAELSINYWKLDVNNLLVRRYKVEQMRCTHRFSFIHLTSQTSPASPLITQQLISNLSLFLTVLCSQELRVGMRTPVVTGTLLAQDVGRASASLCCPPRTAGGTETQQCEQGGEVQGTQE